MLSPAKDVQVLLEDYYVKKWKIMLVLLLAGTVVVTFSKIYSYVNPQIGSNFSIMRNQKGQGEKTVEATAYLAKEGEVKREPVTVVVSEQAYTEEEIQTFFQEAKDENGNIEVYASIYYPEEENSRLDAIQTDQEWKVIENILVSVQEKIREKTEGMEEND